MLRKTLSGMLWRWLSTKASMRPQRNAAENRHAANLPDGISLASMRPQRNAAENTLTEIELGQRLVDASMRPQRNAAENSVQTIVVALLRSEEHTSELQSHSFISYAVFCLKKKNTSIQYHLHVCFVLI